LNPQTPQIKAKKTLFSHVLLAHTPKNVNLAHSIELSTANFNERFAVWITKGFGTVWAFYVLVLWMLLWIALAGVGFWLFRYDQYPFPFLLFCSNLVQLWALPVLAVGQSVLGRKQELLADEQYRTTQKTYHDTEQLLEHLNAQDEELLKQTGILLQLLRAAPTTQQKPLDDSK